MSEQWQPPQGGGWGAPPPGADLTKGGPPAQAPPPGRSSGPQSGPPQPGGQYGYGFQGGPVPPRVPLASRPGVIPLRPLSLGEIYDGAFQVMRRNPVATIGWAAVIGAVTTLAYTLLQGALGPQIARLSDPATISTVGEEELANAFGLYGLGSIVVLVVSLLGSAVLNGVLAIPASRAVLGQSTSFGQAWAQTRPRVWALLGLVLLVFVATLVVFALVVVLGVVLALITPWLLLLLLLVIPLGILAGLWVMVRIGIATPALMLEGTGPVASVRRAGALVGGMWTGPYWRSVGVLLLAAIIAGVAVQLLAVPAYLVAGGVAFANPDDPLAAAGVAPLQLLVLALAGIVGSAVVYPFQASVGVLLYTDHRIRTEGLDVELARAAER